MGADHGLHGDQQTEAVEVRGRRKRLEELVEAPAEVDECGGVERRQSQPVPAVGGCGGEV